MYKNFYSQVQMFPIIRGGWVNPERTATPLTGYRKRAVSASDSGAIQAFQQLPQRELFFLSGSL
jgi:hypothetical protein